MTDWTGILIAVGITALFLVLPAVLKWGRRAERKDMQTLLSSEPLVTAAPVPVGPVQLEGLCRTEEPLTAPLSGLPCVGFRLEASVFVDDTDGGYHWELAVVQELAPFSLQLGEARVAVDVARARLWLISAPTARRDGPLNELPTRLANRVRSQARERYAQDRPDIVPRPSQEVRLVERLLQPDSTALAIGVVTQRRDASGQAMEYRIGPRPGKPLLVASGDRAGLVAAVRVGAPHPVW